MKKILIYIATIIVALMLGAALTVVCTHIDGLSWLAYKPKIGFDALSLNLYVLDLTFGFHLNISIIQLFMLVVSFFVAPKMVSAFISG